MILSPYFFLWFAAVFAVLMGCRCAREDASNPLTLDKAAEKANFGTVTSLGPHRLEVNIIRRNTNSEGVRTERDEQVLMAWQDWDNFRVRRIRDGKVISAFVVARGTLWERTPKGKWARGGDPEPYRADLRLIWNLWDEALSPFLDDIRLIEEGRGVIEGRPVHRYSVTLNEASEPQNPTGDAPPKLPARKLQGTVSIDDATAVRLQAEVHGYWALEGDTYTKEVSFYLVRSHIGEEQEIRPPPARRKARAGGAKSAGKKGGR